MAKKKTVKRTAKKSVVKKRKKNWLSIFFVFVAAGIIGVPLGAIMSLPSSNSNVASQEQPTTTPTPTITQ